MLYIICHFPFSIRLSERIEAKRNLSFFSRFFLLLAIVGKLSTFGKHIIGVYCAPLTKCIPFVWDADGMVFSNAHIAHSERLVAECVVCGIYLLFTRKGMYDR